MAAPEAGENYAQFRARREREDAGSGPSAGVDQFDAKVRAAKATKTPVNPANKVGQLDDAANVEDQVKRTGDTQRHGGVQKLDPEAVKAADKEVNATYKDMGAKGAEAHYEAAARGPERTPTGTPNRADQISPSVAALNNKGGRGGTSGQVTEKAARKPLPPAGRNSTPRQVAGTDSMRGNLEAHAGTIGEAVNRQLPASLAARSREFPGRGAARIAGSAQFGSTSPAQAQDSRSSVRNTPAPAAASPAPRASQGPDRAGIAAHLRSQGDHEGASRVEAGEDFSAKPAAKAVAPSAPSTPAAPAKASPGGKRSIKDINADRNAQEYRDMTGLEPSSNVMYNDRDTKVSQGTPHGSAPVPAPKAAKAAPARKAAPAAPAAQPSTVSDAGSRPVESDLNRNESAHLAKRGPAKASPPRALEESPQIAAAPKAAPSSRPAPPVVPAPSMNRPANPAAVAPAPQKTENAPAAAPAVASAPMPSAVSGDTAPKPSVRTGGSGGSSRRAPVAPAPESSATGTAPKSSGTRPAPGTKGPSAIPVPSINGNGNVYNLHIDHSQHHDNSVHQTVNNWGSNNSTTQSAGSVPRTGGGGSVPRGTSGSPRGAAAGRSPAQPGGSSGTAGQPAAAPASPGYGKASLGQKLGYAALHSNVTGHRSIHETAEDAGVTIPDMHDSSGARIGSVAVDARRYAKSQAKGAQRAAAAKFGATRHRAAGQGTAGNLNAGQFGSTP